MARKAKPKTPTSVREVVQRALCRYTDPDAPAPHDRCHWQTYDRDGASIVEALKAAAPEEFEALRKRIEGE